MKEKIELWAKAQKCNYTLNGAENYYQLCIEAGKNVILENLYILRYNLKCDTDISCVHTEKLGYCLMIEFYR